MAGIPQLREAGWLVGPGRDPQRHLLVRLEEHMDGSGRWSLELFNRRARRGERSKVARLYDNEAAARAALDLIYRLGRNVDVGAEGQGQWRVHTYEPSEYDLRRRR